MRFTSYRLARRTSCALLPLLVCIASLLCCSTAARADEIAVWNFNDSNLTVDHGSGSLTTTILAANVNFSSAGTSVNARLGDAALHGGRVRTDHGAVPRTVVGACPVDLQSRTAAVTDRRDRRVRVYRAGRP